MILIVEPATALTDYALAVVSAILTAKMAERVRKWGQASAALWRAAFACTAIAAALGGTYHGFYPYLSPDRYLALWLTTYYFIGLANCLMIAGAFTAVIRPRPRSWLLVALMAYCLYSGAMLFAAYDNRFVLYSFAGMLAVLFIQAGYARFVRKEWYGTWLFMGAAVSFIGGAVQACRLAPAQDFDHNALFHFIQMFGMYWFYRSGRMLVDRA